MAEQVTQAHELDHADVAANLDALESAFEQNMAALGNITGAVTINPASGELQTATLTGNVTVSFSAGTYEGQRVTLILTQDGTGSRTFTKGTLVHLAGGAVTLTTTATTGKDLLEFIWNGTQWNEVGRSLALA
jgi:hypothetical protein